MPIDPVKIPQNVYIEDRIVGPLTLRQIIIVAIGCGFSYAVWSSISNTYGVVAIPITVLIWIPGVLSFAFAFVRINDLSLLHLCLLMLERINKPSVRTWTPRRGIMINIKTLPTPKNAERAPVSLDQKKEQRISDLSDVLDQEIEESPESEAQTPVRPVDPERIKASTDPDSLMRDLFPKTPHVG